MDLPVQFSERCGCPICQGLRTADFSAASSVPAGEPSGISPQGATVTSTVVPASAPYYVSALVNANGTQWGNSPGGAVTVTYSFMTAVPSYASFQDSYGFAVMSTAQKDATRRALASYSAVSGLTFQEVTDSALGSSIRFGTNYQSGSAGYTYYPSSSPSGGDVYIANNYSYNTTPTEGTYGYLVLVHEIGHALGLKHPGNYNATGGGTEAPYLPTSEDNSNNTVMTYNDLMPYPTAPQAFDIAAIQYLYGVNTSVRTGNDTYDFSSFLIWDGGGTDTLSAAGQTSPVMLDLRAGNRSWIGSQGSSILDSGNVAINYGTTIENAIGGSGNDTVWGNGASNRLEGGDGNDTFYDIAGGDTIVGGNGSDAVFMGNGGDVTLSGVEVLVGSAASNDHLILTGDSTSLLTAAVETITGSSGHDLITLGNRGSTMVIHGVEAMLGGNGQDVVTLGDDNRTLVLSAIDTLIGSSGADTLMAGNRGTTTAVSGIETLVGGNGQDLMTLLNGDVAVSASRIEVLAGSSGTDRVTLSDGDDTLLTAAVETLDGGGGYDVITLGNRGSTMAMRGVEALLGGNGPDIITLLDNSTTLLLAAVESVTGGSGADVILVGNRGTTTSLRAIESLIGGNGSDDITIQDQTGLRFEGRRGADRLSINNASATIVYSSALDGSGAGQSGGQDQITGFHTAGDTVLITGGLRSGTDRNGNGTLDSAVRAPGTVNLNTDELISLTSPVSSLTDNGFAAFRAALGTVAGGTTESALALAHDGAGNTGLYAISSNGDAIIGAEEVRLLAVFTGASLQTGNILFG